jgi:hypothetical protein
MSWSGEGRSERNEVGGEVRKWRNETLLLVRWMWKVKENGKWRVEGGKGYLGFLLLTEMVSDTVK